MRLTSFTDIGRRALMRLASEPDGGACVITPTCRLKGFLDGARSRFIQDLNRHSLADCALPPKGVCYDADHC